TPHTWQVKAANTDLWKALRVLRQELAETQGVPAYLIFHDATLMEMMEKRPQNKQQLAMISGVGEHKLEAYGERFLQCLMAFDESTQPNDSLAESLRLLKMGLTVEAIAQQRSLTQNTIYQHLATAIEKQWLKLDEALPIPLERLKAIQYAFEQYSEDGRLKPVYDAFDGAYHYGVLRCVQAALKHQPLT
ncbi:MAG: HRDC domain-containing protein, partial [Candidatus Thiodiazotropha sp.]